MRPEANMLSKVNAIALTTFRESIRSKILYSFFGFAIFLVLVSSLFSATTIGDQVKLLKDFGLFVTSLFSIAFVVVSGSTLLAKELSKKTVFNILAKPVYRWEFLAGKFLGMAVTAGSMIALMGASLMAYIAIFEGHVDWNLAQAFLFMGLELLIVCAIAIFFSSIVVTPMLVGMFTFGAFLAGRSVTYLAQFARDTEMPEMLRIISQALYWVFPHLDKLYIGNDVVYGFSANFELFVSSICYAVGYAAVMLVLASVIFNKREFN
jgi:ABC-type transport system involved in multi-copper enzyme maturation permease subunit